MRGFAQVDVFTTEPGLGNPVAVVLDADGLDDTAMARFARWTNLSETTFVLPTTAPAADYRVRIFTPTVELPFAGHPTIGTCRALLDAGLLDTGPMPARSQLVQECGAGLIDVTVGPDGVISFAAPTPIVEASPVPAVVLGRLLGGATPADPLLVGEPLLIDVGPRWLVARVTPAELDALRPDAPALLAALGPPRLIGTTLYAVDPRHRVHVRSFFPGGGQLVEDPVCGSGNAAVAAHWQRTEPDDVPPSYQAYQGRHLGRDGRIEVTTGDPIRVGGHAVTMIRGTVAL